MSFWIYQRDKDGTSSVTSVSIPIEMIIIIVGVVAGLLLPRYWHNSAQFGKDTLALFLLGFSLFFIAKISLFKRGIWNSWGSKQMKKTFKYLYRSGYALMIIGMFGSLLFYLKEVM